MRISASLDACETLLASGERFLRVRPPQRLTARNVNRSTECTGNIPPGRHSTAHVVTREMGLSE